MFEHIHEIRVRYAETDQMGIVHHSRYALYLEEARTECMRAAGIPYNKLEEKGIMLPLISMENKFHSSAHYDDLIEVKTIIKSMPKVKFCIDYEIYCNGKLLNTSQTVLVFVDKATRKPIRCPEWIIDRFQKFLSS